MTMEHAVIVAARRTAVGKFGGSLSRIPASTLGARVIAALLQDAKLAPADADEVILGQVLTAGAGQNPARQAAVEAGIPHTVPALTINKVCGSGLKAVALAAQAVRCGDASTVVGGGQESMSMAPHALVGSRNGRRTGNWTMVDTMIHDGLWDAFNDCHMGTTAENIAEEYGISRAEQDAFAAASQRKTEAAQREGRFREQIVPLEIRERGGGSTVFDTDEFPRHGTAADSLSKLRPAFDPGGTVTAGNASGLNDGAAAVVVMSAREAERRGLEPLVRIVAYASAGVDPRIMGTGPIPATERCLEKAGWTVADLDLVEANEAFAVQALCVNRHLGWDTDKVNVNGGAIALGHPIGASGARILVDLIAEMRRRDGRRGLATLCIGGGQGVALALERGAT